VIAFLRGMRHLNGLHRIEALALEGCPNNQRWLEMIGFRREVYGVAHAFFSDRRDVVRFEWLKGDH